MVTKVKTCDLCPSDENAVTSLNISWDSTNREIGLCDYHAGIATSIFAPALGSSYVPSQAGKPKRGPGRPRKSETTANEAKPKRGPGRPRKSETTANETKPKRGPGRPRKSDAQSPAGKSGTVDLAAVREWAWSSGLDVGVRGRIPADIIDKYKQAAA